MENARMSGPAERSENSVRKAHAGGRVPGQLNEGVKLWWHNDLRLAALVERISSFIKSYGDGPIRLGHHLRSRWAPMAASKVAAVSVRFAARRS